MTTDWREFLDYALDGEELTREEMAALREALSDAERRDRAARQVQSRRQLFEELSAPAVDDIWLSRDRLLAKAVLREKSLAVGPSLRPRRRLAMNHRPLWYAGATAVALTIVVLGLTALRNRYPQPMAEGDFHVVRDGQEVSAGQRVDRGEKIIAGRSEAELRLGGYCHLVMKPHTELVLNGQPGAEEVELRSGSLASHIVPGRGEFMCRTPLGVVRVLGTEFVTTVEYPHLTGGETPVKRPVLVTVAVVSGVVAFDLAGQSGTLSAGASRTFAQKEETQMKTGVVRSVGVAGNKLVVMVGTELTFTVTEKTKIRQGSDDKRLADIKVGDRVKVSYNRTGEQRVATNIAIRGAEKKD